MLLLLNAFSLNMLPEGVATNVLALPLTLDQARQALGSGFESVVGHENTASIFSELLGLPVVAQRRSVLLSDGDRAIVGRYRGPRLPEGSCALPDGARVSWVLVVITCERPAAGEGVSGA